MVSEILDPEEISALKNSVNSGDIGTAQGVPGEAEVQPFDLAASDVLLREMGSTIETVGESVAGQLASGLFSLVHRQANIDPLSPTQQSMREFLHSCKTPTFFNYFSSPELGCQGLIMLEPGLVFALADCFFGGSGEMQSSTVEREFSPAEIRISERVSSLFLEVMVQAWSSIKTISLKSERVETQPRFVNIVRASSSVTVCRFQIQIGEAEGVLAWVLPKSGLEVLRQSVDQSGLLSAQTEDSEMASALQEKILTIDVGLSAELAQVRMRIGDLVKLKAGDIIPVELPEQVRIFVDDVAIMRGVLGLHNGQKAFKVGSWLVNTEDFFDECE